MRGLSMATRRTSSKYMRMLHVDPSTVSTIATFDVSTPPFCSPTGLQFLPTIVELFPVADAQLLLSCFQMLLLTEIALECSNLVNIFSYFPPSVRNWMKKGLFLCKGQQDTVSKHLKTKRLKVS